MSNYTPFSEKCKQFVHTYASISAAHINLWSCTGVDSRSFFPKRLLPSTDDYPDPNSADPPA